MSLFTESSLCLVPSGVKDGKVYSIKPTDGSGDLTVIRLILLGVHQVQL
jgi:hypothetical protein